MKTLDPKSDSFTFTFPGSISCDTTRMTCFLENLDTNKIVAEVTVNQLTISPSAIMYDENIKREYFEEEYGDIHDFFLSKKLPGDKVNMYADVVKNTVCEIEDGSMHCFFGEKS